MKKKIATYQEGITLRRKEVEEAKLAITKEEAELSKLKTEEKILKDTVEQLKGNFPSPPPPSKIVLETIIIPA